MTMGKTILITGASTGLGAALAVQAAQAGHDVWATMRDPGKRGTLDAMAAAVGGTLRVLPLEVTDAASVAAAVAAVVAGAGRIDVLVANAGQGFVRSVEQTTEAEIARIMDVNFMGVLRSVRAVLPHMRLAGGGQVIAISSVGGLVGQPFNEVYCASKFAVEGFIESLATYVGPAFGIGFTLVEPGGIRSEFANTARRQILESGGILEDDYKPLLERYLAGGTARGAAGVYQTPEDCAAVVLGVIGQDRPPLRLRTSAWAEAFTRLKTEADPDGTRLTAEVIAAMLGGGG